MSVARARALALSGALLSAALSASVSAQRACPAPDTTASWFRQQQSWLDERRSAWSDSTWRTALLRLPAASSASNDALLGFEIVDAGRPTATGDDASMIARLRALAATRGSVWPTRSVVGARGVLVVWALAARDTTLARLALKRMMEAGPDESPPAAVAILEDRQRLLAGRKQLYGTQLSRTASGALVPLPIEDEAHLALRRDGAELPPLAQSLCAARTP